ncbi:hypothetical protein ACEPAI_4824 [Sanghuangporus weigelae]
MAAPPPYWKKKTRPCPFYSQGRCLFADACNFVHSVKVSPAASCATRLDGSDVSRDVGKDEKRWDAEEVTMQTPVAARSSRSSLSRTPSEKRRRVVLMSPPRSPRLSGLLSALEPLIGPDVEEVEVTDDEDEGEDEEKGQEERGAKHDELAGESVLELVTESSPSLPTSTQPSGESTSLSYYLDSSVLASPPEERDNHDLPTGELQILSTASASKPHPPDVNTLVQAVPDLALLPSPPSAPPSSSPQRATLRSRVPSPIITQHLDRTDPTTTTTLILDNNTLEVHSHSHHQNQYRHHSRHQHLNHTQHTHSYTNASTDDPLTPSRGSRRHSTFELLTSPFTSPAQRILSLSPLSPKLFPAVDPNSPAFSHGALAQHQHQGPGNEIDSKRPYADDDVDSLETLETSESLESSNGESLRASSSSSSRHAFGSDETSITIDSYESPSDGKMEVEDQDIGSPHKTERPSSEYFRTPRNRPSTDGQAAFEREVQSLSPLLSPVMDDNNAKTVELSRPEISDANTTPSTASAEYEPSSSGPVSSSSPPPSIITGEAFNESRLSQDNLVHSEGTLSPSPKAAYRGKEEVGQQVQLEQEISTCFAQTQHDTEQERLSVPIPRRASDESERDIADRSSDSRRNSPATAHSEFVVRQSSDEAQTYAKGSESLDQTLVHHESEEFKQRSLQEKEEEPTSILDDLMQDLQDSSSAVEEPVEVTAGIVRSSATHPLAKPSGSAMDEGDFQRRASSSKAVPLAIPYLAEDMSQDSAEPRSPVKSLSSADQKLRHQEGEELERQTPREGETQLGFVDTSRAGPIHPAETVQMTSIHLTPIATTGTRSNSLESPATLSFGPSPVTPDSVFAHARERVVEPEEDENRSVHETILQRRAKHTSGSPKRLAVVSLTSPTKELQESFFPASLERTIRPSPSPLYEDSQHSASDSVASSSAVSSPRPSWAELQKRSGVSSKVPFGFRQSLLVGQEESSSLARKLSSQFSCDSSTSRTSSTSSLSPTSAFHARRASRVDMLSGRARSVSPALIAAGPSSYRHSVASHSNSAPSFHGRSSSAVPRSASEAEFFTDRVGYASPIQKDEPGSSSSARRASWMKPLRLSQVYSFSSSHSRCSSSLSQSDRFSTTSVHLSQSHVRNISQGAVVQNAQPSSSRSSLISAYLNDSSIPSHNDFTIVPGGEPRMPSVESVLASSTVIVPIDRQKAVHHHSQSTETVDQETGSTVDLLSPLSGSMRGLNFEELSRYQWPDSSHTSVNGDVTLTEDIPPNQPGPPTSYQDTLIPPTSTIPAAVHAAIPVACHAIATPRPTLMFAIASDNPAEVERVLANGEARPNDVIGPQSALEFALTNDALVNKTEIVKTLLAFGADVSTVSPELRNVHDQREREPADGGEKDDVLTDLPSEGTSDTLSKRKKRESALNPAMKYYLNRATAGPQAAQPSAALRRSDFRSLARMRFDFIGQDRALEHLYWVLGMHSQQPIGTPLVVLCCGPCGHGKSLLARKFGSLLNVPTHTVNMTVLKTSHDLWQCPSMSPYDPPSERTLAEFLEENAGKRCVVVLDEIDKNEDERTLWSLLAPWELGRCSIDSGRRHIDVRNVIWLGTSNIGQDLVFEHHAARIEPDTVVSKVEYRELMNSLRPLVTEKLGTSLMSRVTAVLPFVPFTPEEKLAIASEAIIALGGEGASELTPEDFERLALRCVSEYIESDGARSLYRSVSTHLMETL